MVKNLEILHYPDPRLRKAAEPVVEFNDQLQTLVTRMFELMRQDRGVGLAGPQVGVSRRLFVMNPTGNPEDDRVYVNPQLSQPDGSDESEEGCLSLPKIHATVLRSRKIRMRAQNVEGEWFEEEADGYVARIWQHENDHLDGILIVDKMSPLEKLAAKKQLRELEDEFAARHPGWKKKKS